MSGEFDFAELEELRIEAEQLKASYKIMEKDNQQLTNALYNASTWIRLNTRLTKSRNEILRVIARSLNGGWHPTDKD